MVYSSHDPSFGIPANPHLSLPTGVLLKSKFRRMTSNSRDSPRRNRPPMCFTSLLMIGILLHHGTIAVTAFHVVSIKIPRPASISPSSLEPFSVEVPSRLHARRRANTGEVTNGRDPPSSNQKKTTHKPGLRRRVLSRLRRKRGTLKATAVDETPKIQSNFILENFERLSPEQLFASLENSQYVLDAAINETTMHPFFEEPEELAIIDSGTSKAHDDDDEEHELLECKVPRSVIGETSSFQGGPPIRKAVRNWFQNLLYNCFCEWSAEVPVNLQVRCSPTGNAFAQLLRGQLNCNARADFDRMVFNFIRLSGGSIEGSRLALNLLAFTVDRSQQLKECTNRTDTTTSKSRSLGLLEAKKQLPRYLEQFDLHANDCILTQEDLFESSCVRNGLSNLVKRILKRRGIQTSSVIIDGISILHGKVAVKGQAKVKGVIPTRISFEVRSGINFSHRGHVLNFPDLELSVSPESGFFVPIPGVQLDIGNNARIRELMLCGDRKQLRIAASVTITPTHTLKLSSYTQPSGSYSAKFSYDVGKWLTRIGRFSL